MNKTSRRGFLTEAGIAGLSAPFLILASARGQAQDTKSTSEDLQVRKLHNELADKGWIVFSAKTERGDYDLFVSRPNGSGLRNITRTPGFNEVDPHLFPDGKRILYRRVGTLQPKVDYRLPAYGVLVIANADGSDPRTLGGEGDYPHPAVSPDCKQLACLYKKEGKIRIFDIETLKMVKELPRQGIFQQLGWSPDGKEFCGVANVGGVDWNVVTDDITSGKLAILSRVTACTPSWFPDSSGCIFSHRNPGLASDDGGATAKKTGQDPGASWTMIMMGDKEGKDRKLVVAEQYKHLYFAALSPDMKYVIYSRMATELPDVGGPLAVVRLADTPIIDGSWVVLENEYKQYLKNVKRGPILHLDLPGARYANYPNWTFSKL
jgi:hypothetical protein